MLPTSPPTASCIFPLGTDALAHSWPQALRKYGFPPVSLLAQTLCDLREDEEQVLLVAPYWPTRTWFPELISLTTAPPWRIPLRKDLLFTGARHHMAPASKSVEPSSRSVETSCVAPGRDATDLSGLPQVVVEAIARASAPSTRQAYELKWSLFMNCVLLAEMTPDDVRLK